MHSKPGWKVHVPAVLLILAVTAAWILRPAAPRRGSDPPARSDWRTGPPSVYALVQACAAARTAPADRAVRLRYAEMLQAYRFLPAAHREYAELLRLYPKDIAVVHGLAVVRHQQARAEEAARLLLTIADRDPTARLEAAEDVRLAGAPRRCLEVLNGHQDRQSLECLRTQVAAWLDLRQPQNASRLLEPLSRHATHDPTAHLLLVKAFAGGAADTPNATEARFLASAAAQAHNGPLLYAVAQVAERHGDLASAAGGYRQAVDADPRLARAYLHLVAIIERSSRPSVALRAAAYHFRGLYEQAENNPRGAIDAFVQELRLQPRSMPTYIRLSDSFANFDRPVEAIRILRHALTLFPASPECWTKLALVCSDWNRPAEALEAAHSLAKVCGPERVSQAMFLEGRIYLKAAEPERAVAAFREADKRDPANAAVHYWLGRALLEGRPDRQRAMEAVTYLQLSSQSDAGRMSDCFVALGHAHMQMGEFYEAALALEHALEIDPARGDAFALLAQALRRQGDTHGAAAALALYGELDAAGKRERDLLRAIERSGKRPEPRLALAEHYLDMGDLEAARRIYLPAIRWGRPPQAVVRKFREIEEILGIPHE